MYITLLWGMSSFFVFASFIWCQKSTFFILLAFLIPHNLLRHYGNFLKFYISTEFCVYFHNINKKLNCTFHSCHILLLKLAKGIFCQFALFAQNLEMAVTCSIFNIFRKKFARLHIKWFQTSYQNLSKIEGHQPWSITIVIFRDDSHIDFPKISVVPTLTCWPPHPLT